jgi:transposase
MGWLTKCLPPAACVGWLSNDELPVGGPRRGWLERGTCTNDLKQECPRGPIHESWEELMSVIIGVDPHKATHTAVAIDRSEAELARARVRATRKQVPQLLRWAEPLGKRTWAVESAGGLGYLLSQQLVAAGETVLDVPSTLAARIRVLGSGRSDKNDPNDALSVAIAALRTPALREVLAADHAQVLRLLAKRNIDIGSHRTRVVCRLHNVLMELVPGGIAKELNASDAVAFLERIEPTTPIEMARRDLALEVLADVQRLDTQLKQSHRRIRTAVAASQTTVTELFGVGPVLACYLIGFTGDITRFATRDAYAAYNGTAPVERSSGGRVVHRVSQRGNRRLNHALHLAAICQIRQPHSDGRAYFERKLAEGRTKKDAVRSLKRHISNAVYRQLLTDAKRAKP